jgi:hypothetical protein
MAVTGPDFIALPVRDVEAAASFYETRLGTKRTRAVRALPRRPRRSPLVPVLANDRGAGVAEVDRRTAPDAVHQRSEGRQRPQ